MAEQKARGAVSRSCVKSAISEDTSLLHWLQKTIAVRLVPASWHTCDIGSVLLSTPARLSEGLDICDIRTAGLKAIAAEHQEVQHDHRGSLDQGGRFHQPASF
jgi:hypothetical protein